MMLEVKEMNLSSIQIDQSPRMLSSARSILASRIQCSLVEAQAAHGLQDADEVTQVRHQLLPWQSEFNFTYYH